MDDAFAIPIQSFVVADAECQLLALNARHARQQQNASSVVLQGTYPSMTTLVRKICLASRLKRLATIFADGSPAKARLPR